MNQTNRISGLLETQTEKGQKPIEFETFESAVVYYKALCESYVKPEIGSLQAKRIEADVSQWLKKERLYTPKLFRGLKLERAETLKTNVWRK